MKHTFTLVTILLFASFTTLEATGVQEPRDEAAASRYGAGELQLLIVGLMPAVDSFPLIVADSEGYFQDEGLEVTFEVFRDQRYREAALESNSIDATVSDLVNAIRAWANGADYRVITSTQGLFSIVTAADSGLDALDAWPDTPASVETGLLEDSIINYTAQRMLEAAGLNPHAIDIVPTTQIPVRLEMVIAGELEAAVLPEPVSRIATAQGAHELLNTEILDWTPGVVLATGTALRDKPAELEALLRAYDRAVARINTDPDAFREVVVAGAALPPPTAETMLMPTYLPAAVPEAAQVADVAQWMRDLDLIDEIPPYPEIVRERPFQE